MSWYLVENPNVKGLTSTDANGFYEIIIMVSRLAAVTVAKDCAQLIAVVNVETWFGGNSDCQHQRIQDYWRRD